MFQHLILVAFLLSLTAELASCSQSRLCQMATAGAESKCRQSGQSFSRDHAAIWDSLKWINWLFFECAQKYYLWRTNI